MADLNQTTEWPPCGMGICSERARYVDGAGVGFCKEHRYDCGAPPCVIATSSDVFDAWWKAATMGTERGDLAWKGLQYDESPEGEDPYAPDRREPPRAGPWW